MKRLGMVALLLALAGCASGEEEPDQLCRQVSTPAFDMVCVPAVDPEGRLLARIDDEGIGRYIASVWRYDSEEARFFRD